MDTVAEEVARNVVGEPRSYTDQVSLEPPQIFLGRLRRAGPSRPLKCSDGSGAAQQQVVRIGILNNFSQLDPASSC